MKKTQDDVKIQVRFPHDVWTELKRLADKNERSFNKEVIWALREYIVQEKKEVRA